MSRQLKAGRTGVSLFGSLVPLTQPFKQIPQDVQTILEGALEDAAMKSQDESMLYETLKELHERLDVIMFFGILTYLPAQHLDAFVKMNDEGKPRGDIDKFLQENMPNAGEVFAGALAKCREFYVRIVPDVKVGSGGRSGRLL